MNREKLEEQLERVVWRDREFERHKAWLKKALAQITIEKNSWWKKIWLTFKYMSIYKKVAMSFGVISLATIVSLVGLKKIPVNAEYYANWFHNPFSGLSEQKKKSISQEFWRELQKYVADSRYATDLISLGEDKLMILPFDSKGKTTGKAELTRLKLWQYTRVESGDRVVITLGYDEQGVPQYYARGIRDIPASKLKAYQEDARMQLEYLHESESASDRVEVPYQIREHTPTKDDILRNTAPSLNESKILEYFPYDLAKKKERTLTFTDSNGKVVNMGLSDRTPSKLTLYRFTDKTGKKVVIGVGEDHKPYLLFFEQTPGAVRFDAAMHYIFKHFYGKISATGNGAVDWNVMVLISKPLRDASWVKKDLLPVGYQFMIIDRVGLPKDLIKEVKRNYPEVYIKQEVKK